MRRLLNYSWRTFVGDGLGGLIAALIALPYGLAMASLMGLPPVLGLFTSLVVAPVTALLGRNPVLIGGTSSVTVPFLAVAVNQQGLGGAAKVTLVAAVFLMVFSVLRAGRFIARIPVAVVSGFSCGIGVMMIISQLKTILGLSIPVSGATAIITQLSAVLASLGDTRYPPLFYAGVVIGVAMLVAQRFPKAPAPLLGILAAFLAGRLLGLHEAEVGSLPLEPPPFAGFTWSAADVYQVLPSGFALAVVASVNLLITSRVVDHFRGRQRTGRPGDADAELGAYGIANICAGIFGAPMSVGIPARSLANVRCGGTTRMSILLHSLFLLLFLQMGGELVSHIPVPALAGVTAYVGVLLLEWGTWRRLPKMRRSDAAAFLLTASFTLLVNAVAAVAVGCTVYVVTRLAERIRTARGAGLGPLSTAEINE